MVARTGLLIGNVRMLETGESPAAEVLTEMADIVGSALLGVTLGCARCHDDRFLPLKR
jgi:hypothetical protein